MRQRSLRFASIHVLLLAATASCTVPNPNKRYRDAAVDAPVDGSVVPTCTANQALRCDDTKLVSCNAEGTAEVSEPCPFGCNPDEKKCASKPGPVCTANQALRCEGANLVRCNADGSGEANQTCNLGCNSAEKRCLDIAPSNQLGPFLDMSASQPALNLGSSATINTDTGEVKVDGGTVNVRTAALAQNNAPIIQVLIVGNLTARDVVITGTKALAVVSNGDISIRGVFAASAVSYSVPGAGAYNDGSCRGRAGVDGGGAGGGAFGSPGGAGGAFDGGLKGIIPGTAGGAPTGTTTLIPLRGGCDGGAFIADRESASGGGGAIQLVSRSKVIVSGAVAANGAGLGGGGGSGGGILLEAPVVQVSGAVVANGGGGSSASLLSFLVGENGRLDARPAAGWRADGFPFSGGNGAAGAFDATSGTGIASGGYGGSGGGGAGRIRVNTAPAGFHATGIYSPNPSPGPLATR